MKPIIKWPGGKSGEYRKIKDLIPPYERYIEPFFGGGGIFFREKPDRALINDSNSLLMDFYRLVKEQNTLFQEYLGQFVETWDELGEFADLLKEDLLEIFRENKDELEEEDFPARLALCLKKEIDRFKLLFPESFCVNWEALFQNMVSVLWDRMKRMKRLEDKQGQGLGDRDIFKNLETGFRGGYYTHFRSLLNDCNLKRQVLPREQHLAVFYFIREFCYGSMFRYNRKGEFNIPYGGISYNRKDFAGKVEKLFSAEIKGLFSGTEIFNLDFAKFLKKINLTSRDFVFIDPPYDTRFSTYGKNPFNEDDQRRLAKLVCALPARFIMIIKNTSLIQELYQGEPGIKITSFAKLYSYNVRGRNDRSTRHLIIYNF